MLVLRRRVLRCARPALAGTAAALLLLAGCGDDEDSTSAPSTATSSAITPSSAGQTSAEETDESEAPDADTAAFCDGAQGFSDLGDTLSVTDPAELGPALQTAADDLESIDPPAEVASNWQFLIDSLQDFADAVTGADLSTPEGQQQVQDASNAFVTVASGAEVTDLDSYLATNCPQL